MEISSDFPIQWFPTFQMCGTFQYFPLKQRGEIVVDGVNVHVGHHIGDHR